MIVLTLENLDRCFEMAKRSEAKFIGVAIRVPDAPAIEIIINSCSNFDAKLEYYKKTYEADLSHKAVGDTLKIVGFTYGNSFAEIQNNLIQS